MNLTYSFSLLPLPLSRGIRVRAAVTHWHFNSKPHSPYAFRRISCAVFDLKISWRLFRFSHCSALLPRRRQVTGLVFLFFSVFQRMRRPVIQHDFQFTLQKFIKFKVQLAINQTLNFHYLLNIIDQSLRDSTESQLMRGVFLKGVCGAKSLQILLWLQFFGGEHFPTTQKRFKSTDFQLQNHQFRNFGTNFL